MLVFTIVCDYISVDKLKILELCCNTGGKFVCTLVALEVTYDYKCLLMRCYCHYHYKSLAFIVVFIIRILLYTTLNIQVC